MRSTIPFLKAGGKPLDTDPTKFGFLTEYKGDVLDPFALNQFFESHGYVFIRGFFEPHSILKVRAEIANKLHQEEALDPNSEILRCISKPGLQMAFRPDISNASQTLKDLIYSDRVMDFYRAMLGGTPTHYDFTWLRVVAPGIGTYPHCDIVYMGRGTDNIRTMWVPYGDVPLEVGGLLILEGSHRQKELHENYTRLDVDAICENLSGQNQIAVTSTP